GSSYTEIIDVKQCYPNAGPDNTMVLGNTQARGLRDLLRGIRTTNIQHRICAAFFRAASSARRPFSRPGSF
ncbi:hypothetical protein, partial [Mycobacterium sp. VKM Ac-1816D]|uniref:hypothetical protein n=1 Tax=Mycobacterium sp. VKM Ac-1816D TaxID=1273686 RepID=UPI001ED9A964